MDTFTIIGISTIVTLALMVVLYAIIRSHLNLEYITDGAMVLKQRPSDGNNDVVIFSNLQMVVGGSSGSNGRIIWNDTSTHIHNNDNDHPQILENPDLSGQLLFSQKEEDELVLVTPVRYGTDGIPISIEFTDGDGVTTVDTSDFYYMTYQKSDLSHVDPGGVVATL